MLIRYAGTIFLLWGLASTPLKAAGQTAIPQAAVRAAIKLRDAAQHDQTAYRFVTDLTTQIGPRLAGTEADDRAVEWTIARFKAMGFDKVYTEPVTYPVWQRRAEHASIVAPAAQPLAVTAFGYSIATAKGGITAPVIGFDSLAALKNADPALVSGKIVYVTTHMTRRKGPEDYEKGFETRALGPSIAKKMGAVAYLIRSLGTDPHDRSPHTGSLIFTDPQDIVPCAALAQPDADQLERVLKLGKETTLKLDLDVGLAGMHSGRNVIAEVTGRTHPEEIIAIGGHLDSWDLATGAVDDGAGLAITAAAAKLILDMPVRPDRTIRVIAFSNEEGGLWGSRAYAKAHAKDIAQFVLGADSDSGADRILTMTASVKPDARAAIGQIAKVLAPVGVAYDTTKPGAGTSDLHVMHGEGMAALTLLQDLTHYFDYHHSANDTLDKIDPKALSQNVAVYAAASYMAAEAIGNFGSAPHAFDHEEDTSVIKADLKK